MTKKELSYDKAYDELQIILQSLEKDETGIDELGEKVKRALELIHFCKNKLKSTEEEVGKLLEE